MIGDPSGKKTTRPQLTRDEIEANAETYTQQAFKILDPEKTVIDFNGRWLSALGSAGLVRLARESHRRADPGARRLPEALEAQQPIALHELLYPLAQGYDSVALKADVELGGTDQLFNLLVGRDLMRAEGLEPQVVLTLPLLVGTRRRREDVEVSRQLDRRLDPPGDMYGKVMSIPDALLWSWYELLTDVPAAEIAARREARRVRGREPAGREGGSRARDHDATSTARTPPRGRRRTSDALHARRGPGRRRDAGALRRGRRAGRARRSSRWGSPRPCGRRGGKSPKAR